MSNWWEILVFIFLPTLTYNMKLSIGTLYFTAAFLFFHTNAASLICGNVCTCESLKSSNRTMVDCSRVGIGIVPNVDDWPLSTHELDLSINNITVLDVELKHEYLRVLRLNKNNIGEVIPSVFSGLTSLQHLDLSYNNLEEIVDNTFRGLRNLLLLNLSHNKLKLINDFTFSGLLLLQELSLSNNSLIHLQNNHWNRMYELKKLDLSAIGAYSFEANLFHGRDKLEFLDLSQNEFDSVPTMALRSAKNLKYLRLNSNPIEKLGKTSFSKMNSLTKLEINFMMKLKVVEAETFSELKNLSNLELSANSNLRFISPEAFGNLFDNEVKLEKVNLQFNKLSTLAPLPCLRMRKMNLQGNPWKCDCRIGWIKRCSIPEIYAADLKCDFPQSVKGELITKTPEETFSCDMRQSQPLEDAHGNRAVRAASLALGCVLLVVLSILIVSVLKWRRIRDWWQKSTKGPGSVYYVRARANPIDT